MLISSISQINENNYYNTAFCAKAQSKESKVLSDDKIRYSLIAMAALAITGIIYKKLKPTVAEPIKTSTLQDLRESFSKNEMQQFEKEYSNFDFSKFELFNQLQIAHQTDIFKRLFVLLKMQPARPVEIPKIVASNAPENKLREIGNLLNKEFNFISYQINYENITLHDFLNKLQEISQKSEKNYKTLTINNFDKFLKDIKKSGNEESKIKFEQLIDKNQENKVLYIVKEFPENKLDEYYKIFLKFEEPSQSLTKRKK